MALQDYKVRVWDSTEVSYHEFVRGDKPGAEQGSVVSLDFQWLRNKGCGAASMTAWASSWSSAESFLVPENIVEIYLRFGPAFEKVYTGIIDINRSRANVDSTALLEVTRQAIDLVNTLTTVVGAIGASVGGGPVGQVVAAAALSKAKLPDEPTGRIPPGSLTPLPTGF